MSLSPGQVIHGRYRISALLIEGGMSAVYDAMDITLNVRCALKEMMPFPGTLATALPQLYEQFQQEARLLAELRHPSLPRVTNYFEEGGSAYLVMDFIHGKRLDEIIAQKKLSEDEVLGWAAQLMDVLAYCHEQGMIHRDVKPQNVIITSQGQAMLVDFGLAKLVDLDNPRTRTVMQGLGTPEYAPPEQYSTKKGRTDRRTDVYSLGATLYHALVGDPPPVLAERVIDPTSLIPVRRHRDDVGQMTEQTIMKAMALQPSQRFQSIAEMHKALFGLPLPKPRAESAILFGVDAAPSVEPSATTVSLPRLRRITKLGVDYRLGAVALVVGVALLLIVVSAVANRTNMGGAPTATTTATATATSTLAASATATPTPTVAPSSTPTPMASPTLRPPVRRSTRMPESFGPDQSAPVSPTPTQTYTPPPTYTSTPTPTPVPTETPRPQPPQPPQPPPPPPTNTPLPTDIPIATSVPSPTATDIPTATQTPRFTPTPIAPLASPTSPASPTPLSTTPPISPTP